MRGREEITVALVASWEHCASTPLQMEISIRKGMNLRIHHCLRVTRLSRTRALYLWTYFVIAMVIHVKYLAVT